MIQVCLLLLDESLETEQAGRSLRKGSSALWWAIPRRRMGA